jgi:hypothetical protein
MYAILHTCETSRRSAASGDPAPKYQGVERVRTGREEQREREYRRRNEAEAFFTMLHRDWFPYLSAVESRLLSFFFDATFGQQRNEFDFTWSQLERGAPGSHGHPWMVPPIGMCRRSFYEQFGKLENRGIIVRRTNGRCTIVSVNMDWRPAEGVRSLNERLRELEARREDRERDAAEPDDRSKCVSAAPARPQSAREPIAATLEGDRARRGQFAAKVQAKAVDSRAAYIGIWRAAWGETYPGIAIPSWTDKDVAMVLGVLRNRFRDNVAARHDFLDFVVRHWKWIMAEEFHWMRTPPPAYPSLAFLCSRKLSGRFLDAYADRRRREEIEVLPAEQRALAVLIDEGKSREEALLIIGERRALSKVKADDLAVRRDNGDFFRRAEEERAKLNEARRALMGERAKLRQELAAAPRAPAPAPEPFEELDLKPIVIAPLNLDRF